MRVRFYEQTQKSSYEWRVNVQRIDENDIKKWKMKFEYRITGCQKTGLEDVKKRRAHGDLSENFEYHAAKKFKTRMKAVSDICRE